MDDISVVNERLLNPRERDTKVSNHEDGPTLQRVVITLRILKVSFTTLEYWSVHCWPSNWTHALLGRKVLWSFYFESSMIEMCHQIACHRVNEVFWVSFIPWDHLRELQAIECMIVTQATMAKTGFKAQLMVFICVCTSMWCLFLTIGLLISVH